MQPVLAFDVYGTLIDTQGVTVELERRLSDATKAASLPNAGGKNSWSTASATA